MVSIIDGVVYMGPATFDRLKGRGDVVEFHQGPLFPERPQRFNATALKESVEKS